MNNQGNAVRFFALSMAFTMMSILLFAFPNESNVLAQDVERSLNIETWDNQPYKIVSIKVNSKFIEDKIDKSFKIKGGQVNNIKHKDQAGWFKHIKIRVRNIDNKPIIGMSAILYLKHPALQQRIGLPLLPSKNLQQEHLKSGNEIDFEVSAPHLARVLSLLTGEGADENVLSVDLLITNVFFTKDLQWDRGRFLRQNSNDPSKWDTIDKSTIPSPEQSGFNFILSIFKPVSNQVQTNNLTPPDRCADPSNGSYATTHCPEGGGCMLVERVSTDFGRHNREEVFDFCKDPNGAPISCISFVGHSEYFFDSSCPDPCPDNDNDGYTVCQNDCNDNNANINPGKPEDCAAQGDEDCDGGANELDRDCVICDEDEDGFEHMSPPCNGSDCDDEDSYFPLYLASYCGTYQLGNPNFQECTCEYESPIILDVAGNGFLLTSAANGVRFDLDSNGQKEQLGWTRVQSDDAWLVLDRNNNNLIDNGQELFGDFTPQPPPPSGEQLNGFLALAEYDKSASGGNHNGVIDTNDTIFSQLRLWQDINHNGISESNELHKLSEFRLAELELEYKESKRTDEFGNQFKYRAKVKDVHGSRISRWAWDVFLVKGSSTSRTVNPQNNKFKGLIAQLETLSKPIQPFSFLISDLVYTKPVGGCRQNSLVKAIY